jgi:riboflavin synthase
MFTGIIEGFGTISAIQPVGKGRKISIEADFILDQASIGDSIAANGACLTVVRIDKNRFDVDISPETVTRTTFNTIRVGDRVNLERALKLSDRIDGHLVSGHIDGIGIVKQKKSSDNAVLLSFGVPEAFTRYMIKKGSVAVDGISLTINDLETDRFEVSIIPHTARLTTLAEKKVGDPVNIETDMIGKYVERLLSGNKNQSAGTDVKQSSIDMQFLAKSGFL